MRERGKQKWNENKESCVFKLRYEVLIIANNCKQKRINQREIDKNKVKERCENKIQKKKYFYVIFID